MQDVPLVSVIIPTYNHRNYVGQAIESALAQTYIITEIIVIDDGSTDGTGEFLKEFGERITYIYQPNRGRGGARNRGLSLAEGKYIQFLDADDVILPEKIEKQVAYMEQHAAVSVVYGHTLLFYEDHPDNKWEWQREYYVSGQILKHMIHKPFLLPTPSLVRKEWLDKIGGFDENLRRIEDWDLWLRLARAGAVFQYYPDEEVSLYRIRRCNPPEERLLHAECYLRVLKKLERDIGSKHEIRNLGLPLALKQARLQYGKTLVRVGRKWRGMLQIALSVPGKMINVPERLIYLLLSPFLSYDSIESFLGKCLTTYRDLKRYLGLGRRS